MLRQGGEGRGVEIYVSFSRVSMLLLLLLLAEQQMAEEGSCWRQDSAAAPATAPSQRQHLHQAKTIDTHAPLTVDASQNLLSSVIFLHYHQQVQTHAMVRLDRGWHWNIDGTRSVRPGPPFSPALSSLTEWLHFLCAYHFMFSIPGHL